MFLILQQLRLDRKRLLGRRSRNYPRSRCIRRDDVTTCSTCTTCGSVRRDTLLRVDDVVGGVQVRISVLVAAFETLQTRQQQVVVRQAVGKDIKFRNFKLIVDLTMYIVHPSCRHTSSCKLL